MIVNKMNDFDNLLENYYDILGIPRNASEEQIKRAYRKIAVKFHPDKKQGNKVAEEMFREATEAYEVLKDPEKKKRYDSGFARPKTKIKVKRRGSDLRVSVKVSRADLVRGIERIIVIKRKGKCKSCDGTGSIDRKIKKCIYCGGTGLAGFPLALGERKRCLYCEGVGAQPAGIKCFDCKGTSLTPETIRRRITLDSLTARSTVLRDLGNHCFAGVPGTLMVDLDIIEDPNYKVKNFLDIIGKIKISPAQAILGDSVKLSVFGKALTIKIPAGIHNRDTINIHNAGITYKEKTGDFKATVYINIPAIITDQEKELYQKILQIEKEISWPKTLNF